MIKVTLGRTNITVNKNGFGALPIQRISKEEAGKLLRKAYDNGVQYFDTARAYTDSEEKIGYALSDVRDKIYLATKSKALTPEELRKDLETSLRTMKTDYVDVFQFHNPPFLPKPGGEDGLYDEALKMQEEGKLRFISTTSHKIHIANEAIESGLYATLQYPFSYIAAPAELELAKKCKEANVGFIGMKGLAGGLIKCSAAAYAFACLHDNLLPIWGVQREYELDEFLSYQDNPPVLNEELQAQINKDRAELAGDFCRACGYCMPCPAGINIPHAARMSLFLRRSVVAPNLTPAVQEMMHRIPNCLHCNHCKNNCPYGLDTPTLLAANYKDWLTFLK